MPDLNKLSVPHTKMAFIYLCWERQW